MPRLIIRLAVAALGEKRVAAFIAERYSTQGFDDISRAVGRLCSVLKIPYTAGKRATPESYANEIRQNIDVCTGMAMYGIDTSIFLGREWTPNELKQWTESEIAALDDSDTASLRDPYNNAPHTCKHKLGHDTEAKADDSAKA